MAITRVIAEGIGPFDRLDLDFSDANGAAHLGPHILAGVNGSGKTTALRALAWAVSGEDSGFPSSTWIHLVREGAEAFSMVVFREARADPWAWIAASGGRQEVRQEVERLGLPTLQRGSGRQWAGEKRPVLVAAYAPSKSLQYLKKPDLNRVRGKAEQNALAFESTVENEVVQGWLSGLFSKAAIAETHGRSSEVYKRSLTRFREALERIYGEDITLDVELEPVVQPRIRMRGQALNFSQIPDGVRTILGWLADFMERQNLAASQSFEGAGVILIDEIDAHLHPRWQRRVLPALREALPGVQIIVTTHSPFIINSCRGARVHALEVDRGKARARPPVDAPFGQSLNATLKDIFEVDSRFDLKTEEDLKEWNQLKRSEAEGRLTPSDQKRLRKLTAELSERSEELRSIVGVKPGLPAAVVQSLLAPGERSTKAKRGSRPANLKSRAGD